MQIGDILEILVDHASPSNLMTGDKVMIYDINISTNSILVHHHGRQILLSSKGLILGHYKISKPANIQSGIAMSNQYSRLSNIIGWKFQVGQILMSANSFFTYEVMYLDPLLNKYGLRDIYNQVVQDFDTSLIENNFYANGNLSGPGAMPMPSQSPQIGLLTPRVGWSETIKLDMTDSKPNCKHDWRDSRSEGSTKWCASCGQRK